MATNPRIDDLRKRLEKEPGSRLFAQLAEELRKDGELAEAIGVAREGLQKHPSYPSARMTLGRALLDTGDWGAARTEFELVLKSAPDNILASRYLGECLESLGEREAAIARYKATLAMAPGEKHVVARLSELEGGVAAPPRPAAPPARPEARPPMGLRPGTRPPTGPMAPPPVVPPAPAPVAPPPPIPLATVEGEMELDNTRTGPTAVSASAPAPATGSFAPIPLVDAEEEFELERPYESRPTGIGLGQEPAAPDAARTRAVTPAPAAPTPAPEAVEEKEFELEAPHEAPSVGWAATIRPLPVVEEPPPTAVLPPITAPAPTPPPPLAAPAAPPPASPPAAPPLIPATLTSPTLGELYFNQGFTDKAIEVYRDMSLREPENERLSARLKELEKLQRSLSGGEAPPDARFAPVAPVPVVPPTSAPAPTFTPAAFTRPAPVPAAPVAPPPPPTPAPFVAPAPPAPAASPAPGDEPPAATTAFAAPEALAPPSEAPATPAPAPADAAAERREAIERTIARLEGLLSAIRKG